MTIDTSVAHQSFYENDESRAEAERLGAMARMLGDSVSYGSIELLLRNRGLDSGVVLDLGAGDSTTLGATLEEKGVGYLPTDIRPGAVAAHRERFGLAFNTSAIDLAAIEEPLANRVDVVHARALFGWLGKNQRRNAIAAISERVPRAAISITDYDWSVVKGPEVYMSAINRAMGVLRATGFRADYGAYMAKDLTEMMDEVLGPAATFSVDEQRDIIGRDIPISHAMPIIELTAVSLIERLRKLNMRERADEIRDSITELTEYVQYNPDEIVSLPDFVTVRVNVHESDRANKTQAQQAYWFTQLAHGAIDGHVNSLPLTTSGLAVTEYQRLIARRIQAIAYYLDDIVAIEGLRLEEGVLNYEIDSIELVDRSDYVLSTDGVVVKAVIRIIKPVDGNAETLPTVKRLKAHAPKTYDYLRGRGIIGNDISTVEVSGIAKNPLVGSTEDVFDAIISLAYHAKQSGYDYAIMGLQDRHIDAIVAMLGPGVINRVPTDDAAHCIDLPSVNQSMRFVTFFADVNNILEAVEGNAQKGLLSLSADIALQALKKAS